ncbi:MAG: bifunctional (p)ppGpp synthetase/guanosine-3',5'-bis(diphosphate) 3'-pyrophosphohydrolase [Hyphomicrobiaceae bacterium]
MMRQYELVERVQSYDPKADEALLNRAYVYAMRKHGDQKRASGDPYFSHPLEVAAILTELKLDDATIATALLHDTIEDTDTTRAEIDTMFGPEIGALVEGLTKIKKLDLVTKQAEQAENFRKLLLAISSDIRVLMVKLADRLHNMRTLEHMRIDKKARISRETLDIYAPLAGRMGMQSLRDELEDLSFRWIDPEAYAIVTGKLKELGAKSQPFVDEITSALGARLAEGGIKARVSGREKTPFSVWKKMERKQVSLEQLSDIYAFRVVVETVLDCYKALGVVHTSWQIVPGRFKDYVSSPKPNDYRSIHTTIVGPQHQRVELQIRTEAMHQVAEYGVAAHALYKDGEFQGRGGQGAGSPAGRGGGNGITGHDSQAYQWLRRLVETLVEGDNPEEFLENTKLELFQDQVFCFTPKGRLLALPRGATPIDFAYAVHTSVGNRCVGARINGQHRPLKTELRNGDEVQIETSDAQTPPADWETIVKTGKARSTIRRANREANRRRFGELGRQLLRSAFATIGRDYSDDLVAKGLGRLSQKTVEDVLVAVAKSELATEAVIRASLPDAEPPGPRPRDRSRRNRYEGRADEGWFNLTRVMGFKFRLPGLSGAGDQVPGGQGIPIRGLKGNLPVEFGEGGAVPGDKIVGILTPDKGILIFPIHSPKLKDYERFDDWIDVAWDLSEGGSERYRAMIRVTTLNQPGSLARIAQVIGDADGNIDTLRMRTRAADFTEMDIGVEVFDLAHLNDILKGLKSVPVVSDAVRIFGED